MRSAVSRPRSARTSTSLMSEMVSASSLRLVTRSEIAPPSADDVRLSPPVRRHQKPPLVSLAPSLILIPSPPKSVVCARPYRKTGRRVSEARAGARDSGFSKVGNMTHGYVGQPTYLIDIYSHYFHLFPGIAPGDYQGN